MLRKLQHVKPTQTDAKLNGLDVPARNWTHLFDLSGAAPGPRPTAQQHQDEAEARMEAWKYDPWIIAKGDTVDPCSLYLTLRHSADERVRQQLDILISGFLK